MVRIIHFFEFIFLCSYLLPVLDYLDYFERTYVRRRVGGIMREGQFPISCWNCYAAALNGLPRTNNHIEGWHKGFNERFRRSKMSMSQFLIRLKAEEEKTRQILVRFLFTVSALNKTKRNSFHFRARVNPTELRQPRRPEFVNRDANLKILVEEYQQENRLQFLKIVQHHLAKFAFLLERDSDTEEASD